MFEKCSCAVKWRYSMDYKKEIIEMIEKMSNLTFLKMAYGFVRRLYREEKEQGN